MCSGLVAGDRNDPWNGFSLTIQSKGRKMDVSYFLKKITRINGRWHNERLLGNSLLKMGCHMVENNCLGGYKHVLQIPRVWWMPNQYVATKLERSNELWMTTKWRTWQMSFWKIMSDFQSKKERSFRRRSYPFRDHKYGKYIKRSPWQ